VFLKTKGVQQMFRFTIEACGVPVAIIVEADELMLEGFLDGHTDEGKEFRQDLSFIVDRDTGKPLWDGSPLTARLSTLEERTYSDMNGPAPLAWIMSPLDECAPGGVYIFQPYEAAAKSAALESMLAQFSR
jgi:hypothetical protein